MSVPLLQLVPTLAGALNAAVPASVQVWEHVPETPAPPCVVIEPGDDYLQEDDEATFHEQTMIATLDVFVLVPLDEEHDNESAAQQLLDVLPAVLDTLRELDDVWIVGMSKPQAFLTTEWVHHGVRVTVQTRVTLDGDGAPIIIGGSRPVFIGHGPPADDLGWLIDDLYLDVDSGDLYRNEAA